MCASACAFFDSHTSYSLFSDDGSTLIFQVASASIQVTGKHTGSLRRPRIRSVDEDEEQPPSPQPSPTTVASGTVSFSHVRVCVFTCRVTEVVFLDPWLRNRMINVRLFHPPPATLLPSLVDMAGRISLSKSFPVAGWGLRSDSSAMSAAFHSNLMYLF